jgi:hypothetical protein
MSLPYPNLSPRRRMVYRFYDLPYVCRMQVVTKLELTEPEDDAIEEEPLRYAKYFQRAQEKSIIPQLCLAIEAKHKEIK